MNKITTNQSKTIKLTNTLKYKCLLNEEDFDLNIAIEKMQSYIKVKAAAQSGPLIQYTRACINENSEMDMEIIMMLQCSNYIHSVEAPYSMESVLRVADCMYCRYIGPEDKLKFAYDKLNLEAFENDIQLKGENYTIFVDQNEEENTIIADVFMPRADS
ncbi:hypothetical protein [Anaerobium acetethylicum]|uniref:GyrI-like small molecule binding domain-containing protein n=1 Tax=Anaerobium acetethylicum TaxID=1619234 RepID=A0A1D3TZH4_9FIRM|nr:hypothetical protein [Anaerobium acetethylicum]SCP99980.1 hypothetical protein SAMN05421730_10823 [Anaerobium acetethylicum]